MASDHLEGRRARAEYWCRGVSCHSNCSTDARHSRRAGLGRMIVHRAGWIKRRAAHLDASGAHDRATRTAAGLRRAA